MILSRFWYAILAVLCVASTALVYVAIHQHNRLRESDTRLIIDHDRDIVDWYLRIDARKRLDALAIASVDDQLRNGLLKANGQEKVGAEVRDPVKKRLGELAGKIGALIKDEGKGQSPIALFAVDARGRVVAHVNYDRASMVKDEYFELGGFPVVADALHGWLRDDTWVFDREAIYRVVARPVVSAEGSPPSGAVVAVRRVDDGYAKMISERTEAPVVFYVAAPDGDGVRIAARATPDKSDVSFEGLSLDAKKLKADKAYTENGASALTQQGPMTMAFARIIGMGWEMGAGYAVARKVAVIDGPNALLGNADESDKKAVPVPLVAGVGAAALLLGLLFTFLEHSRPISRLAGEVKKFSKGEQDAIPLPKLAGQMRKIGQDVNDGMERVIAKGGGASRKAADLEQILGPVPAAPQMSAFSFNFDQAPGGGPAAPAAPASSPKPAPGIDDMFANLPPAGSGPAPGPSAATSPKPPAATPPAAAPVEKKPEEEDEATLVARIPDELMNASKTGEQQQIDDAEEILHWKQTFDAFVAMRQKCGEPTTGLSFDKFQLQLRKNKEQLVKQYGCKRVKFTVYEKEGKAALKATPIKD